MPPGSKPRKRVKAIKVKTVGRWKEVEGGRRVVLTVRGELWQRGKGVWRLRKGVWTLAKVEAWAAAAGYVRVSTGVAGEESWGRPVDRVGLTLLCKQPTARDPDECRAPVPSAYAPFHAARIERYAARAAAKLPLFAEG